MDCDIVINELISMFVLSVDDKKVSQENEINKENEMLPITSNKKKSIKEQTIDLIEKSRKRLLLRNKKP